MLEENDLKQNYIFNIEIDELNIDEIKNKLKLLKYFNR